MKKLFATLTFVTALALVGCGNVTPAASVPQETTAATTTQEATEPTTSTDKIKLIGDRAAGDTVYIITLDNKTGKDIKSFTVKAETEEEYPANMIDEEDPYVNNERRLLYYVPVKTSDVTYGDDDRIASQEYTIKIEFSDKKTAELHQFPFEDMEEGVIKLEKDVAYIEYTSKLSGDKVSTKEAEKAIAESQEVTEPASEIEDNNNSYYEDPVYQEPVYTQPTYVEPTTVYVEPTTVYVAPTEAPTQAQTEDPNAGCIGGGALTW